MTHTATYRVQGMTCDHCVRAVRDKLARLDGVAGVEVDLASGSVEVASGRPLTGDEVREAVQEAGYELAG